MKFNTVERYSLRATCGIIVVFCGYMMLCMVSVPEWVYDHNTKFAVFIAVMALFNIYTTYSLNRENR